jgi:ribosomal protein S3
MIIYAVKVGMIIGRGGKGLGRNKQFVIDNLKRGKIKELKIDIKIEPVKNHF